MNVNNGNYFWQAVSLLAPKPSRLLLLWRFIARKKDSRERNRASVCVCICPAGSVKRLDILSQIKTFLWSSFECASTKLANQDWEIVPVEIKWLFHLVIDQERNHFVTLFDSENWSNKGIFLVTKMVVGQYYFCLKYSVFKEKRNRGSKGLCQAFPRSFGLLQALFLQKRLQKLGYEARY